MIESRCAGLGVCVCVCIKDLTMQVRSSAQREDSKHKYSTNRRSCNNNTYQLLQTVSAQDGRKIMQIVKSNLSAKGYKRLIMNFQSERFAMNR